MIETDVTVLLPIWRPEFCYHDVMWLREALASICNSLVLPAKIIVIVDGSPSDAFWRSAATDLPAAVRDRCHLLQSSSTLGLSRALNWGLAHAKTRFIARIDQDDRWATGKLCAQLAAFESDPTLSLSFTSMRTIDADGEPIETYPRGMAWAEAIDFAQHLGCPVPHPSALIRRDVLIALGGYPEGPDSFACEDFLLWAKLMRFFKIGGLDLVGLDYRQHAASMSTSRRASQLATTMTIMAGLQRLGDAESYVRAFDRLTAELGHSVLVAGERLFGLWRFGGSLWLPQVTISDCERVLFDRCVNVTGRDSELVQVEVTQL